MICLCNADGLVKVWSTAALLSSEAEADAGAPKLLGVLSHHTGQCHIVRWSPTGRCVCVVLVCVCACKPKTRRARGCRLLASAGNECDVLLWELREGPPASTVKFGAPVSDGTPGAGGGEDGMAPIEHWAVAATCRGHTLGVCAYVLSACLCSQL